MHYYSYYSEVEEHYVRRRKKNIMISPIDWALIQTWKEMGIPLHVVLRGIDQAFDHYDSRPVKTRRVNTLFFCHQSVQECFSQYTQSRVGEAVEESMTSSWVERKEAETLLEQFCRQVSRAHRQANEQEMIALGIVLERARVRLDDLRKALPEEGEPDSDSLERDLQIIDGWITDAIQEAVGLEKVNSWKIDARRELRPYKKRVPAPMFEKILENYLRRRARRDFRLSPLSLFTP